MAICPATLEACMDDICRSGCLKIPGEPMLIPCHGCGGLVAIDGTHNEGCECYPIYDFDPDEGYPIYDFDPDEEDYDR